MPLTTVQNKEELEIFICKNLNAINAFIDERLKNVPIPLTTSVDIREAQHKFAPVDNNLYPAGFNNLCDLDLSKASLHFREFFAREVENYQGKHYGLIIEANTRNTFYLENVYHLVRALTEATKGKVTCLSPGLETNEPVLELETASKKKLTVYREIPWDQIEVLLLNHDQSTPLNISWNQLKIPVFPSPFMGWYRRKKSVHFAAYERLVHDFGQNFGIDPQLISAQFSSVDGVDFASQKGLDRLAQEVDLLREKSSQKGKVFIKGNQGTYGMGIMVVKSGEEILSMNRKERNKMDIGKNHIKFDSVLIQESVETCIFHEGHPAEVTIYCVGGKSIGGFMRANPLRDAESNLNAKGMVFHRFCLTELKEKQLHQRKEAVYSTLARLSTLATGYETLEMQKIQ